MSFCIRGLDPAPFRPLFGLTDSDLAARGASRHVVDSDPGYPDRIGLRDMAIGEHAILLNVGHCFRDQVLDACPELNRQDVPTARTNSLETVRNMVASGLGVSVLPRDALTPKYHSRLVVPVPFSKPVPSRRIALAYRKSFPRPQAIEALLIVECVQILARDGADQLPELVGRMGVIALGSQRFFARQRPEHQQPRIRRDERREGRLARISR